MTIWISIKWFSGKTELYVFEGSLKCVKKYNYILIATSFDIFSWQI